MFFSVRTMNLNWEILTKNQLLLKDEMGLRMKKFSTMGGSLKNPIFRVGVGEGEGPKKSIYRG